MRILIIALARSGGYQLNEWLALELGYKMIHEPIWNNKSIEGNDIVVKYNISEIENITNASDKIEHVSGKLIKYHHLEKRHMGFTANEIKHIIPEMVFEDESDDTKYLFVAYDRVVTLLNEGIK